jgi:ABC-type protease/lipase transport system fused ATPase/permease subunit
LQAERLTFGLPGAAPFFRDLSITVEPGEVLAIVGPSGMGKSTLARILAGIQRPTSGEMRLDGADLFSWPRASVGEVVGYLAQDVELLDGATVFDLISRGAEVEPDAVVAAARAAGCHDMILRLPHGYRTRVGSGGVRLSGPALSFWTSRARIWISKDGAGWLRRWNICARAARRSSW